MCNQIEYILKLIHNIALILFVLVIKLLWTGLY